jgi:hypothetical protein
MDEHWNRCDVCGKFISMDDFDHGAVRELKTPSSDWSMEEFETLCKEHGKLSRQVPAAPC